MQDVVTKGYVPVVLWGGCGSNYGRRCLSEMGLLTSNPEIDIVTSWCTVRWAVSHLHDDASFSDIPFLSLDGACHPSVRDAGNNSLLTYRFFEEMRKLTSTMKSNSILPEHVLQCVVRVKSYFL
jgi:hypothetical protein